MTQNLIQEIVISVGVVVVCNLGSIPIVSSKLFRKLLELYGAEVEGRVVLRVETGSRVDSGFPPVARQHVVLRQVQVQGEEVVVLAVVHVPLLLKIYCI